MEELKNTHLHFQQFPSVWNQGCMLMMHFWAPSRDHLQQAGLVSGSWVSRDEWNYYLFHRSWSKVHCNLSIVGQEAVASLIVGRDPIEGAEFPITRGKEGKGHWREDGGDSS